MLTLTKTFHFEMAHAIHGYLGACRNVHGHSYELHVSVTAEKKSDCYIPAPGFIIDFKEIKKLVTSNVVKKLDHQLVLSKPYLAEHPSLSLQQNLVTWEVEPTAENLLLFVQKVLSKELPPGTRLHYLKLYETKDSYAEWINDNTFNQQ
jgi:6-pyruvoyltetrahydropterin/6-carboxytetrahydropterin synthase